MSSRFIVADPAPTVDEFQAGAWAYDNQGRRLRIVPSRNSKALLVKVQFGRIDENDVFVTRPNSTVIVGASGSYHGAGSVITLPI